MTTPTNKGARASVPLPVLLRTIQVLGQVADEAERENRPAAEKELRTLAEDLQDCYSTVAPAAGVRPEVRDFALALEARLRRFDAEKGATWQAADAPSLVMRAAWNLADAYKRLAEGGERVVVTQIVDAGAYAMFLYAKLKESAVKK